MTHFSRIAILALAVTSLGTAGASAQFLFNVDVNTASLVGNSDGPYYLDFQLNAGDAGNTNSNTAVISNFSFVGGNAPTSTIAIEGSTATSSPTLGLTLSESPASPANEIAFKLAPGITSVSFTVDLTQNAGTVGPDQFLVDIFDTNPNGNSIATTAPNEFSLLQVGITSNNTVSNVQTYTSVSATPADLAADGGSPGAYASLTNTPEPSTWALLVCGGAFLSWWRLPRQREQLASARPSRG